MSTTSLFRDAALGTGSTGARPNQTLVLAGSGARLATATAVAVALAGIVAAVLIKVPITLDGRGLLLESGGVGAITADTVGRVLRLNVTEGDRVKTGDVIAEIAQQELASQTEDARAALTAAEQERVRGLQTMDSTRAALRAHDAVRRTAGMRLIAIEMENLARLQKRQAANEKLAREGFLSTSSVLDGEQEIIASKRRLDELRQPMETAEVERRTRAAEDAQRRLDLDLRVQDAQRKLADLEQTLKRAQQVLSPREGVIAGLRVAIGDVVERQTEIATVVRPDEDGRPRPLLAYSFIPAELGAQIRAGMPARVVPTTVKPEEYGYIVARVQAVSTLPVGMEEMMRLLRNRVLVETLVRQGATVQATLELERAPTASGYRWSSSQGPKMTFTHGTELQARVEVRHERLATIALPWLKQVLP